MSGLGRGYYFLIEASRDADDRVREEEWRRLHQRPDALPLPPEPERLSLTARIASKLPVIRRVVAGRP